jgi:uncharacterized protein (TIGR00369 family)
MAEKLSLTHDLEALRTYVAAFNALPFITQFGVQVALPDPERVRVHIDVLEAIHRGGIQGSAVNGGIQSSLFDLALGLPGLCRAFPEKRTATVQLSMSFMRAIKGERIEGFGWIVRAGGGLLFTESELLDEKGTVCARAQGVVRLLDGATGEKLY